MPTHAEYVASYTVQGLTVEQATALADRSIAQAATAAAGVAAARQALADSKLEHERVWALRGAPGLPFFNTELNRWERA